MTAKKKTTKTPKKSAPVATKEKIETVVEAPPASVADFLQRAVCFSLKLGRYSVRRKISASLVETDAEKEALHLSKETLQSEHLDAIKSLHYEARAWVYARTLPSPFGDGTYMLSTKLVPDVDQKMNDYMAQIADLIRAFKVQFPQAKDQAKLRLRSLYNEMDYPEVDDLDRYFCFQWKFFAADVPAVLKSLKGEIWQREQAKAQEVWRQTQEAASATLRDEFKKYVDHLSERLTPDKDGKAKVFKNTLITNVQEWIDLFEARDIANDTRLMAAVEKARTLIAGVHPKDVRDDEAFRKDIAAGMMKLKADADKLVIEKPKRIINFEE